MANLGQRLKQLRELAGLSQNELAKRADVSRPIISQIESGKQEGIKLLTVQRLARVLGVSLDLLAGKEDDKSEELAAAVA